LDNEGKIKTVFELKKPRRVFARNYLDTEKMIPDRNWNLSKGINNTRKDKYVVKYKPLFLLFLTCL
jgi:hypothetical protein